MSLQRFGRVTSQEGSIIVDTTIVVHIRVAVSTLVKHVGGLLVGGARVVGRRAARLVKFAVGPGRSTQFVELGSQSVQVSGLEQLRAPLRLLLFLAVLVPRRQRQGPRGRQRVWNN